MQLSPHPVLYVLFCASSLTVVHVSSSTSESRASHAQGSSPEQEFSCAAFPRELGEAGLIARYGKENVTSAPVVGWDEGPEPGTVIFPDEDDRRLEVMWWEAESKERMHWIRTRGTGGWWKAPDGLSVGTDLKTIEGRNGWPFRLRGFTGEGYPGRVMSWGTGRLARPPATGCTLSAFLLPETHEVPNMRELGRQLTRGVYSSGHPAMQALNPRVYQMTVDHDWR